MSLTPEQITQLRTKAGLSPTAPTMATSNADTVIAQRKTALGYDAFKKDFSGNAENKPALPPGVDTAAISANPAGNGNMGIVDTAKIVPNATKDAFDLAKEGTYGTAKKILYDIPKEALSLVGEQGVGNAVKNTVLSAPEVLVKTAWGLVPQSAKELANTNALEKIPQQFKSLAEQNGGSYAVAFKKMVDAIPDSISPALKDYADQIDRARQSFENHPLNELLGYIGLKHLGSNPGEALSETKKALSDTKTAVMNPVETIKSVAQDVKDNGNKFITNFKEKRIAPAKKTAETEWNTEIDKQEGKTYNAVQRAKQKGTDIPGILTDRGITSHSLLGEDGRFDTGGTTAQIKREASNLYDITIKPLVRMASEEGKTVNLSDLENKAIEYAKNSGKSQGIIADVIKKIRNEFTAGDEESLANKYGKNGIDLNNAETQKHSHWDEVNWSKIGGKTTNENLFNSAMGHAYQTSIEESLGLAPEAVKAMNAEIGKLRETGDFLNSIDGDKPAMQPSKSVAGTLINRSIKVGAAAAGEALGGGVTGGAAGYLLSKPLADAVTSFITELPAGARDYWLSHLELEQPAIAKQIGEFIQNQNKARGERLALPSPKYIPMEGWKGGVSGVVQPTKPGGLYEYLQNVEASQKAALGKTAPLFNRKPK